MENIRRKPVVFVSSTCYDLKQVREDLRDFFEGNYGFQAMLSEFDSFPIDPCIGTFENCLNNVDRAADIFVLIVGTRYGYVTEQGKSITNLEYLHAKAKGIPIYVFVSKQLYNSLPLWKSNRGGDFSAIVDNSKIFEFVSEIYDESKQWVYTYESVRDIMSAMKQQLSLIFSDGLMYKKITSDSRNLVLDGDIPDGAARVLIEKPFAWEYKFLAHVLKGEFDKLKKDRWNFKYGFFEGHGFNREAEELVDDISERLHEIQKLVGSLNVLVNNSLQDALGEPGEPSDLEMIIYAAKQMSSIYQRLIAWGLYFKSLEVDEIFSPLLQLLYEMPKSLMNELDSFVEQLYREITDLPDVEDGERHEIKISCVISSGNTDEINSEMERLIVELKERRVS